MIVLDKQDIHRDRIYIGIQRPDKAYTYLHWRCKGGRERNRYYFTKFDILLEKYEDIFAIGPNTLVDWSSEDENGIC